MSMPKNNEVVYELAQAGLVVSVRLHLAGSRSGLLVGELQATVSNADGDRVWAEGVSVRTDPHREGERLGKRALANAFRNAADYDL